MSIYSWAPDIYEAKQAGRCSLGVRMKKILIWLVVIIVVIGALWGVTKIASKTGGTGGVSNVSIPAINDQDWVLGNRNANAVLIEYSDFQCPACAAFSPVVEQLNKDFGDKLVIVYRFFPLITIHKNAMISSQAADAAGKQGKFWEIAKVIFENQIQWENNTTPKDVFIEYAHGLSLNVDKFQKDMESPETLSKIQKAYQDALDLKLEGTPTFFLNGKQLAKLPQSYDQFKTLIQNAINNP